MLQQGSITTRHWGEFGTTDPSEISISSLPICSRICINKSFSFSPKISSHSWKKNCHVYVIRKLCYYCRWSISRVQTRLCYFFVHRFVCLLCGQEQRHRGYCQVHFAVDSLNHFSWCCVCSNAIVLHLMGIVLTTPLQCQVVSYYVLVTWVPSIPLSYPARDNIAAQRFHYSTCNR